MLESFLNTFSPMQAAKARACLEMVVKHNGGDLFRRFALIELKVANGATVTTRKSGERVLMNQDGSWLDKQNITKTGIDYAEFLLAH